MRRVLTYIILAAGLCWANTLFGQSTPRKYYVSNSGVDSNPGSKSKPFRTVERVNQLPLQPGDAVYFKGGEMFDGTLSLILNGSISKNIVISSYAKGMATINGGVEQAIILRGQYFRLNQIAAKGAGRKEGNETQGIQLIRVHDAIVEDINVEGFQKAGLELYNGRNITIEKVNAHDNGFSGIFVSGSDKQASGEILIQDCAAKNNPGDPSNLDNHSGSGIIVAHSRKVVIDHCVATNNGWDMPREGNGPVGIWTYESDSVIIQYCISYRNRTKKGAKDGGGFDLDGGVTSSIVQYCLSYENEGAGYGLFQYAGASLWYNNTVRYCISFNDAALTEGAGGFFMWNNSGDSVELADCMIYNNLVYNTHAPAVKFDSSSPNKNFQFINNIFIGKNKIIDGPSSGERFTGNIWWSADEKVQFREYASLVEWSAATGQESANGKLTGKQVDPQLKGPLVTKIIDPYQLHTLEGFQSEEESLAKNGTRAFAEIFRVAFAPHDFYKERIPNVTNPE